MVKWFEDHECFAAALEDAARDETKLVVAAGPVLYPTKVRWVLEYIHSGPLEDVQAGNVQPLHDIEIKTVPRTYTPMTKYPHG